VLEATLCFLLRAGAPGQILLGLKKVGFGQGKYGGVGGKVEAGEAPSHAATREVREETGIVVAESDLRPAACLTFRFPHRPEWTQVVHVYTSTSWSGCASESREIVPAWFTVDAIPLERMWDDCRYWLPRVLAGERVEATFVFSPDNDTVEESDVRSWNPGTGTRAQPIEGEDGESTDHAVAR
jgi:8-oxo-dGTP diphosphatase